MLGILSPLTLLSWLADCPTPNVSVGPPPPLLPYLYPPSLYPSVAAAAAFQGPPLSLFGGAGSGHGGVNPGLLLNAQLALAQQFGHYPHLGQPAGQYPGLFTSYL